MALSGVFTDGSQNTALLYNPYKFSAYRNSAANTGNGAFAQIVFDTENFDTGNNFASGTFTAPVAGFYQFNATLNVTAGTTIIISLFKNGSEFNRGNQSGTTGGYVVSSLMQLAVADTVDVRAFGSGANALAVGTGPQQTYFSGFLVSLT